MRMWRQGDSPKPFVTFIMGFRLSSNRSTTETGAKI